MRPGTSRALRKLRRPPRAAAAGWPAPVSWSRSMSGTDIDTAATTAPVPSRTGTPMQFTKLSCSSWSSAKSWAATSSSSARYCSGEAMVRSVNLTYSIRSAICRHSDRGAAGHQNLADRGAVQRRGTADAGVHPNALDRVELVDVDRLARLVGGQVDRLAGAGVQRTQVRARQGPDVALLQRAVGELEEPGAQQVAVAGVASNEALGLHRAQQPEHGRLVDVEPGSQLLQRLRTLAELAQDDQCAGQ